MATQTAPIQRSAASRRAPVATRKFAPLLVLVVALITMVMIMPSALNLPQSNPSTVLEYAPIAPDDQDQPPPGGNLGALGLGSSGGSSGGGIAPPPPPIKPPTGGGRNPAQKRCVGNPPRQTEDPMAPPCVSYFAGKNAGATWTGVTENEITVIAYWDVGNYITTGEGRSEPSPPAGTYCDMKLPQGSCQGSANTGTEDHVIARATRYMARYFNDRFQTYGREVHVYMHWTNADSEQERRRDAADQYATYAPFAVLDQATFGGFHEAYTDAMASKQVTMFSSEVMVNGDFLRQYAPQAWNFWPDIEHAADLYASYVCTKVKPFPVAHSGNPGENTQPRKYGLMYTSDPAHFELKVFRNAVKRKLTDCGLTWETEVSFPRAGYVQDNSGDQTYAVTNIAELQDKGVTTVLWLGGIEAKTTAAAASAPGGGYFPEWVVMGDGDLDGNSGGRFQEQSVWGDHAWTVSFQLREDQLENTPYYEACREAEPNATRGECSWVSRIYRDYFMLFQAIQVAGSELTPYTIDSGFHAIERIESKSPYVAAFYFDPDDFTGVKDATEQWWDAEATHVRGNEPGCYRMVREGRRFLAWQWPGGDDVFVKRDDPCNGYDGGARYSLAP